MSTPSIDNPPDRPAEVTATELANFLYEWDIEPAYADTNADTLLAHFEIRRRPEALEAAERAQGAREARMYPLTLSDWQRLHETAQRVIREMERMDDDG